MAVAGLSGVSHPGRMGSDSFIHNINVGGPVLDAGAGLTRSQVNAANALFGTVIPIFRFVDRRRQPIIEIENWDRGSSLSRGPVKLVGLTVTMQAGEKVETRDLLASAPRAIAYASELELPWDVDRTAREHGEVRIQLDSWTYEDAGGRQIKVVLGDDSHFITYNTDAIPRVTQTFSYGRLGERGENNGYAVDILVNGESVLANTALLSDVAARDSVA